MKMKVHKIKTDVRYIGRVTGWRLIGLLSLVLAGKSDSEGWRVRCGGCTPL